MDNKRIDLTEVATCELVDELKKREGVGKVDVGPYVDYSITVDDRTMQSTGPAILLTVTD